MKADRTSLTDDRPPRSYYAKMSSKGQVTVPAEVRARLGVGEGDRIAFEPLGDGRFRLVRAESSFEALRGIVKVRRPVANDEVLMAVDEARSAMGRLDIERP